MAVGRLNDLDLELKQNHFPFVIFHFSFLIVNAAATFFKTNGQ
jgi:hypothetical protein